MVTIQCLLSYPLYASQNILRKKIIRSYDPSQSSKKDLFDKDDIFFDGFVNRQAPWIKRKESQGREGKYAVSFTYDVSQGYAGYFIGLNKTDENIAKRYNALQFWIKGDISNIKVEIKDNNTHTFHLQEISNKWQRITVLFSDFSNASKISPNDFKEIVFVVSHHETVPLQGTFEIDQVAFVYLKKEKVLYEISDINLLLNGTPPQRVNRFSNENVVCEVSITNPQKANNLAVRMEAETDNTPWFVCDQKPVTDNQATLTWDASFYPGGNYRIRYQVLSGNETVYISKTLSVIIESDFDWQTFLDMIMFDTFMYFKNEYQPETYLTKDRSGETNIISTGACGFAITIYPLAAERGLIATEEAKQRIQAILGTYLGRLKNIKGFYQHWFDFQYQPQYEAEGVDTVETSYIAAGALFCKQYYEKYVSKQGHCLIALIGSLCLGKQV